MPRRRGAPWRPRCAGNRGARSRSRSERDGEQTSITSFAGEDRSAGNVDVREAPVEERVAGEQRRQQERQHAQGARGRCAAPAAVRTRSAMRDRCVGRCDPVPGCPPRSSTTPRVDRGLVHVDERCNSRARERTATRRSRGRMLAGGVERRVVGELLEPLGPAIGPGPAPRAIPGPIWPTISAEPPCADAITGRPADIASTSRHREHLEAHRREHEGARAEHQRCAPPRAGANPRTGRRRSRGCSSARRSRPVSDHDELDAPGPGARPCLEQDVDALLVGDAPDVQHRGRARRRPGARAGIGDGVRAHDEALGGEPAGDEGVAQAARRRDEPVDRVRPTCRAPG